MTGSRNATADAISKFVGVAGLKIHYNEAGTGKPLLCVRGGGPGATATRETKPRQMWPDAGEDGRQPERLFQPDVELTMWRQFAGKHARGIQTADHSRGYFRRDTASDE